jgi:hypothetical protein
MSLANVKQMSNKSRGNWWEILVAGIYVTKIVTKCVQLYTFLHFDCEMFD